MASSISSSLHDIDCTTSMGLNNATFCWLFGHFVGCFQTTFVELLLQCEFIGTRICQNSTATVANSVTRIGDALAIGAGTHNHLLSPALYNGCVRNTPRMLICKIVSISHRKRA